jgi:methylmalonyl-CoA mutase C-terminal domain/subunit
MELMPEIMSRLKEQDLADVLVVLGGIIPEEDRQPLSDMGIDAVFGPGASTHQIVDYIRADRRGMSEG